MTIKDAKFKDAFAANYTVTPVTINGTNGTVRDIKPNILLSRKFTDYNNFYNNTIVSINGYYHLSDTDSVNGIIVLDAMNSLKHSNQNQIGILSFKNIAPIQTSKFDLSNITTYNDGTIRLDLNQDVSNKTVILSIGGYLHFQNELSFYKVDDSVFKLDFNNLNILSRFYESKDYIDLSSLPIMFSPYNSEMITIDQLVSDENIKAYLSLAQSFIIVLDTPSITLNRQYVKKTGMPGKYITYKEPLYPLVLGLGRHAEYWSIKEDGQYSLSVYDNIIENKQFDTLLTSGLTNTDNDRRPNTPTMLSDAYLLQILKT